MTTYRIERLGSHGDGQAEGPVFAPMTAPGDLVTGTLRDGRLSDVKVVEPSDLRVRPTCRHFKSCGGCALQHVRDDAVADWKRDLIVGALAAHGLETDVRAVITSPARSRRRATFAARRTKSGAIAGFHGRASGTIIPIETCALVGDEVFRGVALAERLAQEGASRKGEISVSVTQTRGGLDIRVTGGKPLDVSLRTALAQLTEAEKLARLTWEDEVVALRTPSEVRFADLGLTPPPGAFLQATEHGQETLIETVLEILGPSQKVVDLFAGCGTFALPVSRQSEVLAVEGDAAMLKALDQAWRMANHLKPLRTERRDLFRNPLLPEDLRRFDAAVIDPPRAGAAAQVAELAGAALPVIAHVSCNPQTFARDAKTLVEAGYALEWIQPVDQFRWSAHVELVGSFRRK